MSSSQFREALHARPAHPVPTRSVCLPLPLAHHPSCPPPLLLLGGQPRRPQSSRAVLPASVVLVVGQCVSGPIILGHYWKVPNQACGESQPSRFLRDIFVETAVLEKRPASMLLLPGWSGPPSGNVKSSDPS